MSDATTGRRDLAGGVAVVTGAGSGIGAATARRLARQGADVLLVDVEEGPAREVAGALVAEGHRARALVRDVTDEDGWQEVARAAAAAGGASVLVANAFTCVVEPAATMSTRDWDRQLQVNLTGTFLGFRALAEQLRRRSGSVVVVSSVHALVGLPGHPAYAASKGGLVALARQLAVDAAPDVRVNAVLPGPIDTRTWDDASEQDRATSAAATMLGRMGTADEVAAAVAFLCSSDASYVTGTALVVDGGWSGTKEY